MYRGPFLFRLSCSFHFQFFVLSFFSGLFLFLPVFFFPSAPHFPSPFCPPSSFVFWTLRCPWPFHSLGLISSFFASPLSTFSCASLFSSHSPLPPTLFFLSSSPWSVFPLSLPLPLLVYSLHFPSPSQSSSPSPTLFSGFVQYWKALEFEFDCLSWKVFEMWQKSLKSPWISK